MKYLVTYDISDDTMRSRLIKLLNEFGRRVQFSCFEIEVTKDDLGELIDKVNSLISDETDKVFFFPISEYAIPFVKKLGRKDGEDNPSMVL
ncbi:MAG: CRISPR-associated endonuclease Cas2 [Desulfurobacteriaceae bacterium]